MEGDAEAGVEAGTTKTTFMIEPPVASRWRRLQDKLATIRANTTVEPVVVLYCLIVALSGIPGGELYVKKACRVNLNHTREVCDNIYNHTEVQMENQKLVSGLQVQKHGILLKNTLLPWFDTKYRRRRMSKMQYVITS